MAQGPEAALVTKIKSAITLRYPEAFIAKMHGSAFSMAGIPDLLVIVDGAAIMLEVKYAKPMETATSVMARVTPLQFATIEKVRKAGGVSEVIWSVEQALDILNSLIPRKDRSDHSKDARLNALAVHENNLRKSNEHLEAELQALRVENQLLKKGKSDDTM